jgi:sugar lactone lactonase YvrE
VNVTLAGVPASVAIAPGTGATIEASASPAYHVPGLFSQPIEAEALDADGNVIIGPGAPKLSAPTVSGSTNVTVVSANGNDSNAYILKATGPAGGQTISVSSSAQGIALNDGTTSAPVSGSQNFTYTPAVVTVAGRLITVFSVETGNPIAQMNVCAGACSTTFGTAVTADSRGDLYVAVTSIAGISQTRVVNVYSTGSQFPTSQLGTSNGVTGAIALNVDKNDMLYVLNAGTGFGFGHHPPSITEYASGATTPTHSISGGSTGLSSPSGIAVDSTGNVYEADGSGFVNVYAPGNQTAPQQTLSDPQLATPNGIAIDNAGALYVSDSTNGYIAYFPPGSTSVTTTISDPTFDANASALLFDPNGDLWVSAGSTSVEELTGASLPTSVSIMKVLSLGGALAWIP